MIRSIFALCIFMIAAPAISQSSAGSNYASVATTLDALQKKPGVAFTHQDGWLIAKEQDGSIWSFVQANHPASPAVGHRRMIERDGRGLRIAGSADEQGIISTIAQMMFRT